MSLGSDDFILDNTTEPKADQPVPSPPDELSPWAVLGIFILLWIAGYLIAGAAIVALALSEGYDLPTLIQSLSEKSPFGTRQLIRGSLLVQHLCLFILPAVGTALIAYRKRWLRYFTLTTPPQLSGIILGILLLLVSMPLVQYSYQINKALPLPQWMLDMEQSTAGMLEAIITKERSFEIIINLFLIAVIPGIGEELAFRGILQKQLGRFFSNQHVTVWVSAAIFSAMHLQFQGFLARMILGALLGYLFIWSRTLWIPIIVHFLNNGIQVLALYALNIKPSEAEQLGQSDKMTWWAALISLVLVVVVSRFIQNRNKTTASLS
jgi:uncharacterized protein